MLTRLRVEGFKNLDAVDVRLGPLTCLAGPNGVGKSNFFDAIELLSALAHKPLLEAATSVRGGDARHGDFKSLFRRRGPELAQRMSFLAEMIVPAFAEDEVRQEAHAAMTYLRYSLTLRLTSRTGASGHAALGVAIESEELAQINKTEAKKNLGFQHTKAWRDSVVIGRRTSPFISTGPLETGESARDVVISLHADTKGGKGGGRPRRAPASTLPRTMLSSANSAAEHRTAICARREMMSWTQLQLEPSALRSPDKFTDPSAVASNGAHVPATLDRLAAAARQLEEGGDENLYARVANRLSELVEDVRTLRVDADEKSQLLSLVLTDVQGTEHLAGALSDGTLRFLALAVMEADPSHRSLLCLEEPENGIHPARVPAMVSLLQDLAVDPNEPVGLDNPLRQVIFNTHSPAVVAEVPDDALLVAHPVQRWVDDRRDRGLRFSPLPDTWRMTLDPDSIPVSRLDLGVYLNPIRGRDIAAPRSTSAPRVKDRPDLQLLLSFAEPRSDG